MSIENFMPIEKTSSISIDVDGIACYQNIHGLQQDGADPIYSHALPRFLDVMDEIGCRATLFVVGSDLEVDARRALIRQAAERGHEIASHSYSHDYGLSLASPAEMDADLHRAADLIFDVCGQRPRGFRAPGYNQSEALFDALERQGIAYDSSFFPTPAYFAARATALLKYRLSGRNSDSLVGDPREFFSQRSPFRPSKNNRTRKAKSTATDDAARSFLELPMTVSSPFRLPWLGTTLALFPDLIGTALTKAVLLPKTPIVLELHAMEFLGSEDGVSAALIALQPDLQVPLHDKLRRLRKSFKLLEKKTTFIRLDELAAKVQGSS